MRRQVLAAAILIATASPLIAKQNPAAQRLLDTARKPTDLFQLSTDPFELQLDFTIQLNVPTRGQFLLKWKSKDQWWTKTILGQFQQITVRNGEMEYTARNFDFTPLRVTQFFDMVQFMRAAPALIAQKQKESLANNISLTCIQARGDEMKNQAREFCLDPVTHDLLAERWLALPGEMNREEFSDYFEFFGIRYPKKLAFFENGSRIISAEVTRLQPSAFRLRLLNPPEDSIARRHCPDIKPAVPFKQPAPHFDRRGKVVGDSAVSITILPDGAVGDIQLIGRGGQSLDQPTLAAVKQWKFKPAMCGSEPVVSDVQVVFSVRK